MKQRYDLLAISLLFASAALVALATVGPTNFTLREWQPLMSAIIALGGGALAYKGAMAKVDFDRASRDRDERRKMLGVYLRAEHTCGRLLDRAKSLEDKTWIANFKPRTVYLDELKISVDAPDLSETWANLELFPRKAAIRLSQVQSCVRSLTNFVASQALDTQWQIGQGHPYTTQMKVTHDLAVDLCSACEDVLSEIRPVIRSMSRDEQEK